MSEDLIEAAARGDYWRVKELLDRGAHVNTRDKHGETPLHHAAWMGHLDVAELLLDRGAEVDARDNYGSTPLHHAARGGRLKVVKLLLDRGADVNARNKAGWTPLDLARAGGHKKVVELLESARGGSRARVGRGDVAGTPPAGVVDPASAVLWVERAIERGRELLREATSHKP
ncbi:ankyrin repeat domain-containing protein [Infirmifilum lucidum]|uniref:Ankyrin repeat domain-containing protein n=1 Tax=Infirmifilum lucidum TaxID=2776706 RepID=A0A7L9FJ60_9CREN|nr:ankyrin repeat domain-containing protein [Infirmifilum lucidum]QOJ78954.1 ankyrin repeat domain-containing protein [Infirmifilum lucidum]